ncbi:MAG: ROK family transcriptional regulator [Firmicutes bacterium]|jgi:N-acetylglucosamine repressor|nr:ROK family transcriptional regulator [Bacillota bacterium]
MVRPSENGQRMASSTSGISLVLQLLAKQDALSRIELARLTGLTPSAITTVVQKLLQLDLIKEAGKQSSTGGRRARLLEINPKAGNVLAVEFDQEETTIALSDLCGSLNSSRTYKTSSGSAQVMVDTLVQCINGFIREHKLRKQDIKAVGVSTQGMVDSDLGTVSSPVSFQWKRPIPLREMLESGIGIPVVIEQDARLAAIAEARFGAAKDTTDLIYINIGTGIGAGILHDGKLFTGAQHGAGEFGHTTVDYSGEPCLCGNVGCIENIASIPAMALQYRRRLIEAGQSVEGFSSNVFITALADRSPLAVEVFENAMQYLGYGLINLVNLFDPRLVVIGGPLSVLGQSAFQPIADMIRESRIHGASGGAELVVSKLGDKVQLLGAVTLALDKLFAFTIPGLI